MAINDDFYKSRMFIGPAHQIIIDKMIKNGIVISAVLKDKLEFDCLRIDTKWSDLSSLIIEPYN